MTHCTLASSILSVSQRQQNALKYVTEEWASIEYELLRERGLWGPPIGSHLDKFMLEMTEGPCRMRKKMVRNDMFYIHYPYVPETETNTNSAQVLCFKSAFTRSHKPLQDFSRYERTRGKYSFEE